ncbi:MAG: hypothetical protein V1907_01640 [Candidatus Kerfeldbacteria bacterium]
MKKIASVIVIVVAAVLFARHSAHAIGPCNGTPIPIKVITRDAGGTLQAGINYVVYQQLTNPDGGPYFGSVVASGKTDAGGQSALICGDAKKFPFAVKIYESSATYGYFTIWSNQMTQTDTLMYIAEIKMSGLYVLMRNAENNVIKKAYFDVYLQGYDVNNQPIVDETRLDVDKLVISNYDTGDFGAKNTFLAAGNYVVRVKMSGGKDYFYLWNQQVSAGAVTLLDYKLSTLRTIVEDGYGNLVLSQKISIYVQDHDVRGKAILGAQVVSDLSTGSTGGAVAYLKPGTYVIRINGSNGYFYRYNVVMTSQELTTVTYRMSGFRIIIRDATGAVIKGAKFNIGTQRIDAAGKPVLVTTILTNISTGELGYRDVYLPPETYVLVYGDKRMYQLDVNDNQFTKIDWPRNVTLRPQSEVQLSNPYGNLNLTLRKVSTPKVKLAGYSAAFSKAYKVSATSIKKSYTVTFYYDSNKLAAKNVKADKLKIAFYNESTKKWQYAGKNYPSSGRASATLKSKGTILLVSVK